MENSPVFFFQAEDGIRAGHVTGVQTCALPILGGAFGQFLRVRSAEQEGEIAGAVQLGVVINENAQSKLPCSHRSEERREGKSVDLDGSSSIKRKKEGILYKTE